ncbi:response regulator transcription factor [Anaerosphaera multitolerans]|uniref:response regulator transcription factor n=1 Tax=Anaerosphaera multitolerans TaxID=2487351 RepID=UPI00196B2690|nr:response regulator transcription factor [Anaerosphaera multitolerans]
MIVIFTILVVEDDYDIRELIQNYLENEGYKVLLAPDGEKAIEIYYKNNVDLILLDLMLPKIDGYSVCKTIREDSKVPIIMLTALDEVRNQLKGYDMEIEDYITKPFSMEILLKKIEVVLRRYKKEKYNNIIRYRDLILDLDGYMVILKNRNIKLTQREFELLKILLQNQGTVLSRQVLLDRIWDYSYFGDERIVDTHIKNLRKKIGEDYIETIRGVGYKIDKEY